MKRGGGGGGSRNLQNTDIKHTEEILLTVIYHFWNNSLLNSDKGRRNQASRVAGKLRFFIRNFENPP